MTLGLDTEDLDRLYWQEFMKLLEETQLRKDKEIANLISQGYSKLEAAMQIELLDRISASAATTAKLISANNLRIQSQLESKGMKF